VVLQRAPNPLRDFLVLPRVREKDGGALGESVELVKFRLQIPFEIHHHDRLARSLRDLFDQFNFLLHPF
jgi:hypothetical protein